MDNEIIWLAEICVFQETGLFPHEYKENERSLCTDICNTFALIGKQRAQKIVFSQITR